MDGDTHITTLPFTITQNPLDCSGKYSPAASIISDLTEDYNAGIDLPVPVTAGFSSFFQTSEAVNCAPSNCQLFDSDCTTAFSGDPALLSISTTYPFEIKVVKNHRPGFSYSICLKCFALDGTQIVTSTPWTYT